MEESFLSLTAVEGSFVDLLVRPVEVEPLVMDAVALKAWIWEKIVVLLALETVVVVIVSLETFEKSGIVEAKKFEVTAILLVRFLPEALETVVATFPVT